MRHRQWARIAVACGAALALAGCLSSAPDAAGGSGDPNGLVGRPSAAPGSTTSTPPPAAATDPLTSTGTVTAVIDGDTIAVDGQTVRLIGVDAPESGACGHDEATAAMTTLVAGQAVTLTAVEGRGDADTDGRLLRYVDVGGTDVGLREIELGLAVARDDGRDGGGAHPRQDAYVAADAAAADVACPAPAASAAAPAARAPLVGDPGGGACDPSYPDVCIPPAPPDLDCGDISERRFTVLPPDPHRFDGNNDGVGCESG